MAAMKEEVFRAFALKAFEVLMLAPAMEWTNGYVEGGRFKRDPNMCWESALKLAEMMTNTYVQYAGKL